MILILACVLDAAMGDPRWLPHPVVLMGKMIDRLDTALRKSFENLRLAGVILAVTVIGTAYITSALIWNMLQSISSHNATSPIAAVLMIYLVSTTIAARGLITSVRDVFNATDIETARIKLSMIVGRDTANLDREAVNRAAFETLAENASDGIVAPLFYFAIGGLPLAMLYKAVNTLDSMVGYKNDKYRDLGWASARLDDLMNYIPARLTGLLIALASYAITNANPARSLTIMIHHGGRHKSPNAGRPEAALAGAIGIKLGGSSTYEGITVDKPFIGESVDETADNAQSTSIELMIATSVIAMTLTALGTLIRTGV